MSISQKRWPIALTRDGFTTVSDFFLDNYSNLKPALTHGEAIFVIHVLRYKWDLRNPFPSFARIAEQMGISTESARRLGRSVETKGLLKRINRQGRSNVFDFTGLFEKLVELKLSEDHRSGITAPEYDPPL